MIRTTATLMTALVLAAPAFAESHGGDAAAGEEAFGQCATCHVVADADGNILAGKRAKTGPNLHGVVGRQAGTVEGFRYGSSLVEAGEAGLVWDEANLTEYLMDPKGYLQTYLDDNRARSKMSFRVREEADAANLAAFLATFSEQMEGEAGDTEGAATN